MNGWSFPGPEFTGMPAIFPDKAVCPSSGGNNAYMYIRDRIIFGAGLFNFFKQIGFMPYSRVNISYSGVVIKKLYF